MDVVVRPRRVVDRNPGGSRLRVGKVFCRVAITLEVRAPRLISLVPVAGGFGVVPAKLKKIIWGFCVLSK